MDQGSEVQSEYDEQIERLESETAEHIKKLTSEIVGKWKQELTESHTTIQRKNTLLVDSDNTLTKLKAELEQCKHDLKQSRQDVTYRDEDIKRSKTVLEKTQCELEVARTELSELTSEKITLQTSIESLQVRFNKEITDYKTKVKDLNTELRQCKLQLTILKDDVKHREEKLERFCTETDNLTKDHESKLEELQEKLQQSEQREKDTKAELDRLRDGLQISEQQPKYTKAQLDSKQIEIERLTQLVEISEAHINSQTNERKTLDAEFARKDQAHEQTLQKWQQEIGKKDQEYTNALQQWQQEMAQLQDELKKYKKRDIDMKAAIDSLQDKLHQSEQRVKDMKSEHNRVKEECSIVIRGLLTKFERLSKKAGDQLMNNNPNITDLSDENGPTKISEKYFELYDNDWTDAFEDEENESGSEEKAVKSLHKMLLDVHKFCQKESKDHSDRLKKFVRSTESKDQPDIPVTKLRQLSFAADMVESVAEKYIKRENPSIKGKPNTERYIRRCVELCWLMSVQDPPVLINDKLTSGLFDGDLFRTYTKMGKTIDFVVWPPLLLHENGPVLCKGVAQGK